MLILSKRGITIITVFLLVLLAFNACAQWSPGGSMVYMGDLNLATSHSIKSPMILGNSPINKIEVNNSSQTNVSTNNTTIEPTIVSNVIDLTHYGKDRANKNLTGYKNIMYPISESRGSTAGTAGTGGGCSSCGG